MGALVACACLVDVANALTARSCDSSDGSVAPYQ